MARIHWIEDSQAQGETAALYARIKGEHPLGIVPAIMRTMSLRPDFLEPIREAANRLHFRDGALSRAQHEMIASYVSALNRCRY
jgi:hypothetical protein